MADIHLVNQNQSSANGTTSCTLTMAECGIGNMLILAYAVRGDGNDPTLTDGWTKLGGGNNAADPTSSVQRLYFAYKVATSESETVTLTQTVTSRIYMVCSEYFGTLSAIMRDDLAAYGETAYTVKGGKTNTDDVMVYGVTTAYYTGDSGRFQTVTPSKYMEKIEGDSAQERLACWFDFGGGAQELSFCASTGTGAISDAVLECVQLLPAETSGGTDEPGGDDEPAGDGENYQIERATLEGLGDQVRRLCNVEGVLQPPQMTAQLEGLNIELEEAYVYATTEEQTITPSEGYYGFSKIVVEAVDEDDGSGGGGTGGEIDYPDADSGSFGNVIDPAETYTGRYIYNGKSLPAVPDEAAALPYRIIFYSIEKDLYYLYCDTNPFYARTQTDGSVQLTSYPMGGNDTRTYRIPYSTAETATNWVWNATGNYSTNVGGTTGYTLLWTNHDIYFFNTGEWTASDEKYTSGTSASREMKDGVVSLPTTTEEYYVISGNSLNALAAEVQRITGADGLYSVNAMIAALRTV